MNGATLTIPGPILDMLAEGLREMDDRPPSSISAPFGVVREVALRTDAGDVLRFERGEDMERT